MHVTALKLIIFNFSTFKNCFFHFLITLFDLGFSLLALVFCGSYYLPQGDLGFYQHNPKMLLPGGFKRVPRTDHKARTYALPQEYNNSNNNIMIQTSDRSVQGCVANTKSCVCNQETLSLFPLHPTDILQGRKIITAVTIYSLGSIFKIS